MKRRCGNSEAVRYWYGNRYLSNLVTNLSVLCFLQNFEVKLILNFLYARFGAEANSFNQNKWVMLTRHWGFIWVFYTVRDGMDETYFWTRLWKFFETLASAPEENEKKNEISMKIFEWKKFAQTKQRKLPEQIMYFRRTKSTDLKWIPA